MEVILVVFSELVIDGHFDPQIRDEQIVLIAQNLLLVGYDAVVDHKHVLDDLHRTTMP